MAALLKDAIKPNLVQTLEGTPALVHGGPFANIAHGCNSITATKMALKLGDYAITEAGFGADLGAEKFFDIKCRYGGLKPSAVVIVATVRALKMHGGLSKDMLGTCDLDALKKGIPNLLRHISNIRDIYGLPSVVAINKFPTDTEEELNLLMDTCRRMGVNAVISQVWEKGGEGGTDLAREVVKLCREESDFRFCYGLESGIEEKIDLIVKRVYRGRGAALTAAAKKDLDKIIRLGYGDLPVCMAKTQYSFSDNASLIGAPEEDVYKRQALGRDYIAPVI